MGQRGPIERPRVVKALEGAPTTTEPHQGAFVPLRSAPEPPTWLAPEAQTLWSHLAPRLTEARLLTAENLPSLEGLCSVYATARRADEILQADGLTIAIGERGYRQQRPEVSISHKNWSLFRQYADTFGMTPAGAKRLGLEAPLEEKENSIAKYLSTV